MVLSDIGNLHPRVTVADLEPKLIKYGTITNLWVAKNPPGMNYRFVDVHHAFGSKCFILLSNARCPDLEEFSTSIPSNDL